MRTLTLAQYESLLARLPSAAVARLRDAWGEPADDPDVRDGAFHFRAQKFGKVLVALPPDRGRAAERRADYHDPLLPPRHALVAFGLWLQHVAKVDALVHMGAHGTLEWLPGKAVALTAECFPEIVTGRAAGDLSVHRQQSGRSGAGQAPHRRRDHRPSAAAACCRRAERRRARARAPDRRICAGRRPRPPPPRAAGDADRRDRAAHRLGARSRHRPARSRPTRRCAASMPGCAISKTSPSRTACTFTAARPPASTIRCGSKRRGRARGAARGARRQPRRARPGRRADARAARRAADRPQSLHRRSAHPADADRDGSRPARRRRSRARASADPRRDAARGRHRSVGQRHACAPAARRSRKALR